MRWICVFAVFMVQAAYSGQILTTNDFDDIEKECRVQNKKSLVLFDVDATLIVPNDAILQPKGKDLFESLISGYIDRDLFREIRMKAPHSAVDSRSVSFIRKLQRQKVPVIALTAAPAKVKGSEYPGVWRVEELKRYGFDFQRVFSKNNSIEFPKNDGYQQCPMFKLGVLYSSFHPKGDILVSFLNHLNLRPEKVIFVNDELKHVQSVVSSLDQIGIECVGIHYIAANETHYEVNPELARLQVEHFVKNDVWLGDKEALDILNVSNQFYRVSN